MVGSDQKAKHGNSSSPVTASVDDEGHCVILDSGATFHASGDRYVLSSLELDDHSARVDPTAAFHRRDGKALPVAGTGTVAACGKNFNLAGVRYVPDLGPGVTLVSVQQLAASSLLVMFRGDFCCITEAGNGGRIVGKGRLHDNDGFYHLKFLRVPADLGAADEEEEMDGVAA